MPHTALMTGVIQPRHLQIRLCRLPFALIAKTQPYTIMNTRLVSFVPKFIITLAAGAAFAALPLAAKTDAAPASGEVTVTGEVLDMACYLDHGAHGADHASCAKKCISS